MQNYNLPASLLLSLALTFGCSKTPSQPANSLPADYNPAPSNPAPTSNVVETPAVAEPIVPKSSYRTLEMSTDYSAYGKFESWLCEYVYQRGGGAAGCKKGIRMTFDNPIYAKTAQLHYYGEGLSVEEVWIETASSKFSSTPFGNIHLTPPVELPDQYTTHLCGSGRLEGLTPKFSVNDTIKSINIAVKLPDSKLEKSDMKFVLDIEE